MKILFLPSASIELLDAINFYDFHSSELGLAFKKEFFAHQHRHPRSYLR